MATIYFDLDGTLYNLYGQKNWLERITTQADPTAYSNENATLVDMVALQDVIFKLMDKGYNIGAITWLAKGASKEYNKAVRKVKREWIDKFLPMATEVHITKYGTSKHRLAKDKQGILVDDNAYILEKWNLGLTIDAKKNLIPQLEMLVG